MTRLSNLTIDPVLKYPSTADLGVRGTSQFDLIGLYAGTARHQAILYLQRIALQDGNGRRRTIVYPRYIRLHQGRRTHVTRTIRQPRPQQPTSYSPRPTTHNVRNQAACDLATHDVGHNGHHLKVRPMSTQQSQSEKVSRTDADVVETNSTGDTLFGGLRHTATPLGTQRIRPTIRDRGPVQQIHMANTDPYDGHGEDHRGAIHQQRGLHAWHRNGNNVRPRRTIPTRKRILATIFQLYRNVLDTFVRETPKY